jgi:hypothetical protein
VGPNRGTVQHLPSGTEKSQESHCPSRDLNQAPPEYESRALALPTPAQDGLSFKTKGNVFVSEEHVASTFKVQE